MIDCRLFGVEWGVDYPLFGVVRGLKWAIKRRRKAGCQTRNRKVSGGQRAFIHRSNDRTLVRWLSRAFCHNCERGESVGIDSSLRRGGPLCPPSFPHSRPHRESSVSICHSRLDTESRGGVDRSAYLSGNPGVWRSAFTRIATADLNPG